MKANGLVRRQQSILHPIILLSLIPGFAFVTQHFQIEHYVEQGYFHQLIVSYGLWAPLVYLTIWTFAPSFLIPATPLVIVGGVVFGPVWGEVYVILGATAGAVLSFLISRYLAREWVVSKLTGNGFLSFDQLVGQKGWKVVALSRLIPIFPFSLVNYAFGLTSVSLPAFILSTFLGIIPLTTAYVYLSANVVDILLGKNNLDNIFMIIVSSIVVITITLIFKKKFGKDLLLKIDGKHTGILRKFILNQ